jgi:hypothetical protein
MKLLCLLLVFVAVALCAPTQRDQANCTDANGCICNQQCEFCHSHVWTSPKYFLLATDPLYNNNVYDWTWDGDSDFFTPSNECDIDNVCNNYLNEGVNSACRTAWVYTYRQQYRIAQSGRGESFVYLNLAYQPAVDAWENYCLGNTEIPEYEASNPQTYGLNEADYVYAVSYAHYDNFYCTLTQSTNPVVTEKACTPHRWMDLPSTYFCNGFNTLAGGNCAYTYAYDTATCDSKSGSCMNLEYTDITSTNNGGFSCDVSRSKKVDRRAKPIQKVASESQTLRKKANIETRSSARAVTFDKDINCGYLDNIVWQY